MLKRYQDQFKSQLQSFVDQGLLRQRSALEGPQGRTATIAGETYLNFCSNNYLGLANDERVTQAFKQGLDRWGSGSGSADLVCGHSQAHQALEEALAEFTGRQRALLFSTGYAANLGTIQGLLSNGDQIFEDRLNHASLIDGGRISGAKFRRYTHKDYSHLNQLLTDHPPLEGKRAVIVSDGIFSMDGDACELDQLVELSQKHDCLLMIDDAHGIGVLGENGCGLVSPEKYSCHEVPIIMGTLGKALGTAGAFVAGDSDLIEVLIHQARTYMFSTAMPPALACATLKSLEIVKEESWRREHLRKLIDRFQAGAAQLGLNLLPSQTAIQPLVIGDASKALQLSALLLDKGILVKAIRPPTVPENTSRLRITFTTSHTAEDIELLLSALDDCLDPESLKIISL